MPWASFYYVQGALTNVTPAALKAVDQDKQHAVQYSLVRGKLEIVN